MEVILDTSRRHLTITLQFFRNATYTYWLLNFKIQWLVCHEWSYWVMGNIIYLNRSWFPNWNDHRINERSLMLHSGWKCIFVYTLQFNLIQYNSHSKKYYWHLFLPLESTRSIVIAILELSISSSSVGVCQVFVFTGRAEYHCMYRKSCIKPFVAAEGAMWSWFKWQEVWKS